MEPESVTLKCVLKGIWKVLRRVATEVEDAVPPTARARMVHICYVTDPRKRAHASCKGGNIPEG